MVVYFDNFKKIDDPSRTQLEHASFVLILASVFISDFWRLLILPHDCQKWNVCFLWFFQVLSSSKKFGGACWSLVWHQNTLICAYQRFSERIRANNIFFSNFEIFSPLKIHFRIAKNIFGTSDGLWAGIIARKIASKKFLADVCIASACSGPYRTHPVDSSEF